MKLLGSVYFKVELKPHVFGVVEAQQVWYAMHAAKQEVTSPDTRAEYGKDTTLSSWQENSIYLP